MKKQLLLLLAAAGCYATSSAQTITYFHETNLSERTVEPYPVSQNPYEFVMTETFRDPDGGENNDIHFVHYEQIFPNDPVIINEMRFGLPDYDERNVDVVYNPNTQLYAVFVSAREYSSGGNNFAKVFIVDVWGNLYNSNAFESTDPAYPNLYPLDGAYDPNMDQYIIAGTAMETWTDHAPNVKKMAFVATLDGMLNLINFMVYESDPGLGFDLDYDIANKIIIDQNLGGYYITGSENVDKNGQHVMGIRNMLIDPGSLASIWRNPLQFTDRSSDENSVDMLIAPDPAGNMSYCVLSNSTSNNKWHIFRIDPSTGLPFPGNDYAATLFGYDSYGHSIMEGENGSEVVISGMKYRYDGNCYNWDQEATPFMATVDVTSSWPGTLVDHIEYNTQVGNQSYWTFDNTIYTPTGLYPVPNYLNNFADREGPGWEYSVVTPIYFGQTGLLNTKYLSVASWTENKCDDIYCFYGGLDFNYFVIDVPPALHEYYPAWQYTIPDIDMLEAPHIENGNCESGWNKPGATTALGQVENRREVHVYPNPVISEITVELPADYKGRNTQIALYDVVGKQIALLHNGTIEKTTLKFGLPETVTTGIYLLQINTGDQQTTIKKIVVDR